MVSQRLESRAIRFEAQPRNIKKIGRIIAVLALSSSMIFGASSASGENSPKANEVEVQAHDQYQAAIAGAYQKAESEIARQRAIEKKIKAAQIHWLETMAWNEAAKPKIVYDSALWERLHHCEQPDTWHAGGKFGNGLPSGGNGLGMSLDAWATAVSDAARRGVTLPSSGWDASIDQQMQAAQVFWEDQGWGWTCHV